MVVSIEESKDTTKMSVDELQSTLVVHEQKFRRGYEENEDHALKVEDKFGTRGRGRFSPRGRGRGRGRASFNKAEVECYKSHNLGHFQYECLTWSKEANYAEFNQKDEVLLMAYIEQHELRRKDAWFIDSWCSNHMCGDKGMFASLDTTFSDTVKLGNNTRLNVEGKGTVKLWLNCVCYVLNDVYYVSALKINLLSMGQLQEKKVFVSFDEGVCTMYHKTKGKMT